MTQRIYKTILYGSTLNSRCTHTDNKLYLGNGILCAVRKSSCSLTQFYCNEKEEDKSRDVKGGQLIMMLYDYIYG